MIRHFLRYLPLWLAAAVGFLWLVQRATAQYSVDVAQFVVHQQFVRCLLRSAATHGYYSSFDGGDSAIKMAGSDCAQEFRATCQANPQWDGMACITHGAIDAQIVLKNKDR